MEKVGARQIIGLFQLFNTSQKKDMHKNTIDKIIVIKPVSYAGADTSNDKDKTSQ